MPDGYIEGVTEADLRDVPDDLKSVVHVSRWGPAHYDLRLVGERAVYVCDRTRSDKRDGPGDLLNTLDGALERVESVLVANRSKS